MSESFAELFEQSQIEAKMRPGTIISAMVVEINDDTVIVNAGLKSEGLIPIDQFFDKHGEIEVIVGLVGDSSSFPVTVKSGMVNE